MDDQGSLAPAILFSYNVFMTMQLASTSNSDINLNGKDAFKTDWLGLDWHGLAWIGMASLGLAWLGMAWHGLAWLGMAWLVRGMSWFGLYVAWLVLD